VGIVDLRCQLDIKVVDLVMVRKTRCQSTNAETLRIRSHGVKVGTVNG
jgi:hypothetical protein